MSGLVKPDTDRTDTDISYRNVRCPACSDTPDSKDQRSKDLGIGDKSARGVGMDNELESFRKLDFIKLATSLGYQRDEQESRGKSHILRGCGEKLAVRERSDGSWCYFNVHDPEDRGCIVNLVQRHTGGNLGHVRKEIRQLAGLVTTSPQYPKQRTVEPPPAVDPRRKTEEVWKSARWNPEPAYLLGRGLSSLTMTAPCFLDSFREDRRGNILFPHRDRIGFMGYELRNVGFKGFGRDTHKALWFSKNLSEAKTLLLCESSIDCMSHYQLHGGDSAYVSIGGTLSELQRDLLTGLFIKAQRRSARVIVATDNDAEGESYFEQLQLLSPFRLERETPAGKDWNDDLRFVNLENA